MEADADSFSIHSGSPLPDLIRSGSAISCSTLLRGEELVAKQLDACMLSRHDANAAVAAQPVADAGPSLLDEVAALRAQVLALEAARQEDKQSLRQALEDHEETAQALESSLKLQDLQEAALLRAESRAHEEAEEKFAAQSQIVQLQGEVQQAMEQRPPPQWEKAHKEHEMTIEALRAELAKQNADAASRMEEALAKCQAEMRQSCMEQAEQVAAGGLAEAKAEYTAALQQAQELQSQLQQERQALQQAKQQLALCQTPAVKTEHLVVLLTPPPRLPVATASPTPPPQKAGATSAAQEMPTVPTTPAPVPVKGLPSAQQASALPCPAHPPIHPGASPTDAPASASPSTAPSALTLDVQEFLCDVTLAPKISGRLCVMLFRWPIVGYQRLYVPKRVQQADAVAKVLQT